MKKAIYPGSFDPITNGHLDIIERSSKIFDKLVVAIANNSEKKTLFEPNEREEIINLSINHLDNVEVKIFNGLLIDFAKQEKLNIIVRGLRVLSDFEYEFKMALMNRNLDDEITNLFMMAHEKYTHISSSLIKEVLSHGGNIDDYIPNAILIDPCSGNSFHTFLFTIT